MNRMGAVLPLADAATFVRDRVRACSWLESPRVAVSLMRTVRAAATEAEASNPRVSVFATTPHKHTQILKKAPDTVVAAIEDVIHRSS